MEIEDKRHFAVVKKIDDYFVYLADPSWGNLKITFKEFERIWKGIILIVFPKNNFIDLPEDIDIETFKDMLNWSFIRL